MTSAVGIGRLLLAATAINASLTGMSSKLVEDWPRLIALGALLYNTNNKLERNHEEAEARMDELEGTLRGHIGLIEESLDRIEGKQDGVNQEGRGKGMGMKAEELYTSRGGKQSSN